ncbi:MAG: hypothetical protein SV375_17720 [Thermodesulfobacteriota bacterium]|nr:hypothetical protein [Thermodesulfobacteriota bacterium]
MTKRIISMLLMFLLAAFFIPNAFADEYTKLLIHSDTTNGSTTFEDSSDSGHSITPNGDVHHSTAQAKFGGSSIYFGGNGGDG